MVLKVDPSGLPRVIGDNTSDLAISLQIEVPASLSSFLSPNLLNLTPISTSGTLIKVRNSGDVVGFVEGVTPSQIQCRIISVQGF